MEPGCVPVGSNAGSNGQAARGQQPGRHSVSVEVLTASRLTDSSRQSRTCLTVCFSSAACRPGGGRFSGCSDAEGLGFRGGGCSPSHSAPLWPGEEVQRMTDTLRGDWGHFISTLNTG
ncbi:hypothetical protein EYF80_063161 [Liparis tanakae]|uniref:Uncharacterized protein n=1 Tax=Liparis tanakae TaxID=230148 RepID=A0A4Z2EEJ0_9TELE|nr:hypothetical protein EYF80_063161 [Liparis tanakae]